VSDLENEEILIEVEVEVRFEILHKDQHKYKVPHYYCTLSFEAFLPSSSQMRWQEPGGQDNNGPCAH
jgi:hypothetical protein